MQKTSKFIELNHRNLLFKLKIIIVHNVTFFVPPLIGPIQWVIFDDISHLSIPYAKASSHERWTTHTLISASKENYIFNITVLILCSYRCCWVTLDSIPNEFHYIVKLELFPSNENDINAECTECCGCFNSSPIDYTKYDLQVIFSILFYSLLIFSIVLLNFFLSIR